MHTKSDSLFSQCCGTVDIRTRWCVCRINRWTRNSAEQAEPTENYDYAFLTFDIHYDDLDFFEDVIKPERFIQALDHAVF